MTGSPRRRLDYFAGAGLVSALVEAVMIEGEPQTCTGTCQYVISATDNTDGQRGWIRCSKCAALCYETSASDPSKCPADGQRHACSGEVFVIIQSPTGVGTLEVQVDWRWCKQCGVLAYSGGSSTAGRCAAGGPHEFVLAGSNYALQGVIGPDTVLAEAFLESIA